MTAFVGDDPTSVARPVALVTGAAGGVGSATAHRFVAGGWQVVVTDIDALGARRTADAVGAMANITGDLRDVDACRSIVSTCITATGRLDCLVNAAGVWAQGDASQVAEADFDRVLDVNLKGLFFVTAAAIPHLAVSSGCVVNVGCAPGLQGGAGAVAYAASKAAVSSLTRSLALELAPQGVRVNAVSPGDIDTPLIRHRADLAGVENANDFVAELLAQYPQGQAARLVRPDEVAELIWFLAQPASSAITGADLRIDFGRSAGI